MQQAIPGQRWISTSEPALGLGVVGEVEHGRVELIYPAVEEKRIYAFESAPLVRVRFEKGDMISDRDGREMEVEVVEERDGLLVYLGGGLEFDEMDLLDSLNFVRPEKRLLAGLADSPREFDQRLRALGWNTRIRKSAARGFTGARIDLIPHQLAIVGETAGRLHPRVMLADEVGLGKTIEACLILHRLHLTGRAGRVLVLVPEALVHQWFVELLRRFNMMFAIFDEERCRSIETGGEGASNPFYDSQLVLAATGFLAGNPERAAQAVAAGFDLLVVDEAHHLEWSRDEVSVEYEMVESLARVVPSLLLLTATPQQLGPEGHFARLRLLDPDRYSDLAEFEAEADSYAPLAEVVEGLLAGEVPDGVEEFVGKLPGAGDKLAALRAGDEGVREPLIRGLIDLFGTGRVLFRNTRERLQGFPERQPVLHPLAEGESPYVWLAGLLKSLGEEKVLLITSSPDAAVAVREKLLEEIQVESALFHEDLSMLQRDRNAAWFADPEGARILICSEIGSEGRNFQFARHLVLFGLPRDPELLEQRIGRLDRIGQKGTIEIHVPYGVGSRSELQARWLHEGLDAFSRPLKGATSLATTLLPELDELEPEGLDAFLTRSRKVKEEVTLELASGHDRLLELGAPGAEVAEDLEDAIFEADDDRKFEKFVIRLFDQLGLDVSDLAARTYHFGRGQRHGDAFADLPEEGLSATFDRDTALAREDLAFLTMDHPVFLGALEHMLDGGSGNASFAIWKAGMGKGVFLECAFVVDAVAPTRLHVERFLPPSLVKVTVDHRGQLVSGVLPRAALVQGDPRQLVGQDVFRREMFPMMLESARKLADEMGGSLVERAREEAAKAIGAELDRLKGLAARNPQVSGMEIEGLEDELAEVDEVLAKPRLRLDALRLVWRS